MSYDPTGTKLDDLNKDIRASLTVLADYLNKLNAHLELITDEEDPPREPTEDL
jgi:hypothetical protein